MGDAELMELSPRALRFLSTLERRQAVPTEEVEAAISAAGCPAFAPWLAFHERYAGYLEQYYQDWFVWGLVHRETYWWTPNQACCEQDGPVWSIWCAEGHPTYSYQLDQDGVFAAHGEHRSFDLYVERLAAFREFVPSKKVARDLPREEFHGSEFGAMFADRIRPFRVDELSDQFWHYYINDTLLVIENAESGKLSSAWERVRSAEPSAAADGGGI